MDVLGERPRGFGPRRSSCASFRAASGERVWECKGALSELREELTAGVSELIVRSSSISCRCARMTLSCLSRASSWAFTDSCWA